VVSPSPQQSPCRVLVVDDNQDFADLNVILISRWGHDARAAYSGQECITLAQTFKPHLILLDIGLPGIDGYEVAKQLSAIDFVPRPIIAAMSGYVDEKHIARCIELGITHRFKKPVENSKLQKFIASVCHDVPEA
jgi:CheY-like chemotaxis protein